MKANHWQRVIRAYLRDTWVLVRQFRGTLLIFFLFLLVGTVIIRFAYSPGSPLRWGHAFYLAFHLMFFETLADYPVHPLAQMVFILWPVLGILLVVNGVVQFGTALFNRQGRKEAWQVAVASTYRNHIVVCGLGRVGYRVASQLLNMQQEIVVIEQNPKTPFLDLIRDEGVPTIIGDARNSELLKKAGVEVASAVVACTEDDLTNLEIALDAREMVPGIKIVMRMFDHQLADRVRRGFGIHTVFSTSALAAPAFAAAATRAAVEYSLYVDDVLLNVSRTTIASGSPLIGKPVEEVEHELDLSIVLHRGEAGVDYHPSADLVLAEGDQIVVFATLEALACLKQVNQEGDCQQLKDEGRSWLDRLRRKRDR
jgi:Trk K+ transport system NAD-binding subunit